MGTYSAESVGELARQAYQGNPAIPLAAARAALLVIDMQDEFVRPGWTPYWVPAATCAVPRIRELIACCRRTGVPVIYTAFHANHHYLDRPRSGPLMPNRYPGREERGWFCNARIWEELAPQPNELVLLKPSYGAFYDTPLETILKNLGRDTVIISGTLTSFCCGMTARQVHEAELKVLRKGFARVMTGAQIAAALEAA